MTNRNETEAPSDPLILRDKALNLRESVNSSKARLFAQRERLNRLRAEVSALRALAETRPAAPAAAAPAPAALPARSAAVAVAPRPAPILKEAASDSAPAAVSFRLDAPSLPRRAAPYAALLAVAVGVQFAASPRTETPAPEPGVAAAVRSAADASLAIPAEETAEDDGAQQALLLVHEYRLPGDERPLAERLNAAPNPPGSRPAWTAERTGERTYRVSYQPADADISYDFDADLDARRVDPTPETAELIAPRLASRR